MSGKTNGTIAAVIGLLLLAALVLWSPFKDDENKGFEQWLYTQAEEQEETSDKVTTEAVKPLEGEDGPVGEHKDDGSNWSIPNIIRHILFGED